MTIKNEVKNKLILGDNLDILKTLKDESVDLIYIDPPFFSNRNYEVVFGDEAEIRSFEDRWEGGINVYVEWMRERMRELHRVSKPTGSFYLHCDYHASHHLRVMLDEVFGKDNFQNEIIWYYRGGGIAKGRFGRRHDNIYFYTKGDKWTFNADAVRTPYSEETLERLQYKAKAFRGEKVYDKYEANPLGKHPDDVWIIQPIMPSAKERLGYPTQKPEALLEKIIKASSNKGDVVLDSFCGCGTSLAVAQKLNRHWVGIDISPTAIKLVEKRLNKLGARKDETYITINTPTTDNDLKAFKPFEFQNWVIDELGARHSEKNVGDMGLDGYFEKDLWHEKAGVQVKQSDGVGRNVVDNFETALKRKKYTKGYIVAFSFSKGAYEEAARIKKEGLEIKLIKVSELLNKKGPIL
jgi:DNA modification methylase